MGVLDKVIEQRKSELPPGVYDERGFRNDRPWVHRGNEWMWDELGGFDQYGFPTSGRLPEGAIAAQAQLLANRQAFKRNEGIWRDAQNVMDQGLSTLSQYRPGGASALASGFYPGMANLLMAGQSEAPDLMYYARQDAAKDAQKHATKMGLISAGAGILGAAVGGLLSGGTGLSLSASYNPTEMAAGGGYTGPQDQPVPGGGMDTSKNPGYGSPTGEAPAQAPMGGPTTGPAGPGPTGAAAPSGIPGGQIPAPGSAGGGPGAMQAPGQQGPSAPAGQQQGGGAAGPSGAGPLGGGGAGGGVGPMAMGGGGDAGFTVPGAPIPQGVVEQLAGPRGFNPTMMMDVALSAEPELFGEDFNSAMANRLGRMIAMDQPVLV